MRPAPEWLKLADVDAEAERFTRHGFASLRFPPVLEGQFHTERAHGRRRELTIDGLIALAIFDLFIVGDYLQAPQMLPKAIIVRFGIVTPLVIVALLIRGRRRVLIHELWSVLLCLLAVAGSLVLQHDLDPEVSLQAEPGVLLLLLAMNTLLRPDFRLSIAATAVCCGECLAFLVMDARLTLAQQFAIGGRVFWFAALSLVANYTLAREQRFAWLQHLRARIQHRMLTDSNRELLNLSYTDQLTGLPNRAAYGKRLVELWDRACSTHESLAAIMVDVDFFKSINDSFGHLYGDRVLQRVASLLEQALRAEADFVARFGGEEFIVLLPGSTMEGGIQVAERIRLLVQVAGSPAPIRGEGPLPPDTRWSTVSCGVAAVFPNAGTDPCDLIDAADAALYTAKQTGRNRVCADAFLPLPAPGPRPSGIWRAMKRSSPQ